MCLLQAQVLDALHAVLSGSHPKAGANSYLRSRYVISPNPHTHLHMSCTICE